MNEIMFGAAYYPEYMPYDRIETDVLMMKQAGMNVVRIAESTWSTLEPEEGTFDFSFIDKVLEATEKAGIHVIIGTPTYAVPAWLVKKDPDILVCEKEGQALYGRRQNMDITNPVYRKYAERVIRALLEHTASAGNVIGFQIDNETKHYGNAGKRVQEQFVEYLKQKFGTVEKLNAAYGLAYWSNSIADWEDFPDMRGCVNGGLASEFSKFQRRLAQEFLSWQAGLVREYKREDQFITHNLDFEWRKFGAGIAQDGYSYGVQPDIEHDKAAACLTVAGADIYHPTQDDLTGAEIAFGGDEIRSLKKAPYLILECQAQAFKYWTPYPGQLRLHAYSHLACGAEGLMYWNWHSIHNGFETYWKGLLSHDLLTNPAYEEAAAFGEEWKRIGKERLCVIKKNRAALVVDNISLTAFQWFPVDRDLSYNDVVRWMYDSLYELNFACDVVFADALKPEDYQVIITPALYSADEKLLTALKKFVAGGGILLGSFKSFVADRNLSVYHDVQPHDLTECFGMTYQQYTEPGRARLWGKPVNYFAELLQLKGAEGIAWYEHPYWKSYAGITRNSYGRGSAWYIGCYTEKENLKKLYRKIWAETGIAENLSGAEWPLIIRSGVNALGRELHYVLNYSETEQEWTCAWEQAEDLLTGRKYQKGEKIHVKDWGVCALEEP